METKNVLVFESAIADLLFLTFILAPKPPKTLSKVQRLTLVLLLFVQFSPFQVNIRGVNLKCNWNPKPQCSYLINGKRDGEGWSMQVRLNIFMLVTDVFLYDNNLLYF